MKGIFRPPSWFKGRGGWAAGYLIHPGQVFTIGEPSPFPLSIGQWTGRKPWFRKAETKEVYVYNREDLKKLLTTKELPPWK